MFKTTYFDRNVFDHIRRRNNITDEEFQVLKSVAQSGELIILRSISLIEEALVLLKNQPQVAREEWQLLNQLTNNFKVIKHHEELLRDDVLAYARGELPPDPFTAEFDDFTRYLAPTDEVRDDLLSVIQEIEKEKDAARAILQNAKDNDTKYFDSLPKGKLPTFKKYYSDHVNQVVSDLCEQFNALSQCNARGIYGLLKIKSVQLYAGANLSLGFAITREGQATSKGDWHDMQHAVLASAAEIFVTQDNKLAKNLRRIGIQNFQIIDLRTLLQMIDDHYTIK